MQAQKDRAFMFGIWFGLGFLNEPVQNKKSRNLNRANLYSDLKLVNPISVHMSVLRFSW